MKNKTQKKVYWTALALLAALSLSAAESQPRGYTIPTIDLSAEKHRQIIVDREKGQYLGHPTTVLSLGTKIPPSCLSAEGIADSFIFFPGYTASRGRVVAEPGAREETLAKMGVTP